MQLVSLSAVYALSYGLAEKIRAVGYRPDVIVAIARGGFVPARFLCDFLNLSAMTSMKVQHYAAGAKKERLATVTYPLAADVRAQKVLIVDDVNDTGDTLRAALEHVSAREPADIKTAVLHEKANSSFRVDFWSERLSDWRWVIYPWAIVEDIGSFLSQMDPPVVSIGEAAERLRQDYDIEVSREHLEKVFSLTMDQ